MTKTNTFLIHYGELGLKGENRGDFEKALERDLMSKIADLTTEDNQAEFETRNKYFILKVAKSIDNEKIIKRIKRVFGIKWFAEVKELAHENDLAEIKKEIVRLAQKKAAPERTFKIDCKRADKRFHQTSQEIEIQVGSAVINSTKYQNVNLSNPDDTFYIEITHSQILIFDKKIAGPGGLPIGASGRVLVLLSGGIDSPVAAYLAAKRGCSVDFLNFYVKKPGKNDKIPRLARQISEFTGKGRLYLVPYLPFNMEILDTDTRYELVLFRRFMFKVAENVMMQQGHKALITGDNLGQVASQTIENITAADDALKNYTCLRPLIGYDKCEIIEVAKEIGTFKISNEKQKDCCSIIDKHAKTKVSLERINKEESKLEDYNTIIVKTLKDLYSQSIPF
jgi:thiamine biosynthesis protein ThiI